MKYAITAATGHYGAAALQSLLDLGAAPSDVVALVRSPEKAADLAAKGVEVRQFDYKGDLSGGFAGVDRVLFIPTADHGGRVEMNKNVIDAAQAAGVTDLVYVSFVNATEFPDSPLTPDHAETEKILAASSMNTLSLRSGFYFENVLGGADAYVQMGALPSVSGDAKISAASRAELAEAAARLLYADTVPSGVMTLVGAPLTKGDMAQAIADAAGRPVQLAEVSPEEYQKGLVSAGMPEEVAASYTKVDEATGAGALYAESTDLAKVLGREPKTFAQAAKEWVATR